MDWIEWFDSSSEKYVTSAVNNVEDNMAKNNGILNYKCKTSFKAGYFPEFICDFGSEGWWCAVLSGVDWISRLICETWESRHIVWSHSDI